MIAVDTNILVRFLVNDDPRQAAKAKNLVRTREIWVSRTVVLETEWVLRYFYKLTRREVDEALSLLLGLEALTFEARPAILRAMVWFRAGFDFADAMHLASTGPAHRFATFDRGLARSAGNVVDAPEVLRL